MKEPIHFPGQHPGENVVMVIRRHPITLLFYFISVLFIAPAPIIFFVVGPMFLPALFVPPITNLFIYFTTIFYLFLWIFIFIALIDYYYDIWILTTERVLDINQNRLFRRYVSELKLTKIQDITSEVPGFLATLLGFGNIYLQSAGEIERFSFETIPHPVETRKIIVDLQSRALRGTLAAPQSLPEKQDNGL